MKRSVDKQSTTGAQASFSKMKGDINDMIDGGHLDNANERFV